VQQDLGVLGGRDCAACKLARAFGMTVLELRAGVSAERDEIQRADFVSLLYG
jgi:hypothetical protein